MTQDRFKELFDDWRNEWLGEYKRDFWIYISYYQQSKTNFYYEKGYNACLQVGYPKCIHGVENPYKKDDPAPDGCIPYDEFERGYTQGCADEEYYFNVLRK